MKPELEENSLDELHATALECAGPTTIRRLRGIHPGIGGSCSA